MPSIPPPPTDSGKVPRRKPLRVAGHTLDREGRPRLLADCCGTTSTDGWPNHYDRFGHGRCSCGSVGPCQTSDAARRRWHLEHKAAVLSASPGPDGEDE